MLKHATAASVCPYCGVGCGLLLNTSGGKLAGLEYMRAHPTNEGALCPKGNACLEIAYHTERLLYPLKRVGDEFVRVAWGEALDLVAKNLHHIQTEHGADALAFLASAKVTNEENYLFQKMARMLGTNNIDHCARL